MDYLMRHDAIETEDVPEPGTPAAALEEPDALAEMLDTRKWPEEIWLDNTEE